MVRIHLLVQLYLRFFRIVNYQKIRKKKLKKLLMTSSEAEGREVVVDTPIAINVRKCYFLVEFFFENYNVITQTAFIIYLD